MKLATATVPNKAKKKTKDQSIRLTASKADRHILYQASVQCVEADIDFFERLSKSKRGEPFRLLKEDFCGTAALASEFVRTAQTEDVRRLVTGDEFDEALGIALLRELPNPVWGHREYLDVLRAVHTVNRDKDEGAERFEVLGHHTFVGSNYVFTKCQRRVTDPECLGSIVDQFDDYIDFRIIQDLVDVSGQ